MDARNDAKVVHVFVEDPSVVLAEDVYEWLKIIDDIEEMKLQYDTAQQCSFYWVQFKHPFAAQQAVNYLDGLKLKNHVVHIRSNVYTKNLLSNTEMIESSENMFKKELNLKVNPILPLNHLMPSDLQMDDALINIIPSLASISEINSLYTEMYKELKELQESYTRIMEILKKKNEEISNMDREVTTILRGKANMSSATIVENNNIDSFVSCNDDKKLKQSEEEEEEEEEEKKFKKNCRISNRIEIPLSLFDPASIIAKLTRYVGPVSDYSFTLNSPEGKSFYATVEFFHSDDATLALNYLKISQINNKNAKKRNRWEYETVEALSSLVMFDWVEDASVEPLKPLDISLNLYSEHNEAMRILQSLLQN